MQSQMVRLDSLTGLRFFAAIFVVLYHCFVYLYPQLELAFGLGFTGVSFFFVLSGFVLAWSHRSEDRAGKFYARRFARIYPLHVLTTILAIVFYLVATEPIPWVALVPVLLLVHAWNPFWRYDFNGVSWSLSAEAFFYFIFPFVMNRLIALSAASRRRRGILILFVLIMVASAILIALPSRTWNALTYTNPAFRVGEFLLGMLLAIAFREGWRPQISRLTATVVLLAGFIFLYVFELTGWIHTFIRPLHGVDSLILLPGFVLFVIVYANRDIGGHSSVFARPVVRRLGEWSFALYMIHELVLRFVAVLHPATDPARVCLTIAGVIASVGLSGVLYTWFERPVEKRLKALMSFRERSVARAARP